MKAPFRKLFILRLDRLRLLILFLFLPNRNAFASINKRIVLTQPTDLNLSQVMASKRNTLSIPLLTKTFPNHFTLVTGLYEESHGIVANTFFDPIFSDTFYLDAVSKHYLDSKWWNGEPVWITNQKAFKKSAVVFWPGSEVKIEGQYPTHYLPYNRSLSFEKRIDYLCTMLEQDDLPSFLAA